MTELTDKQLKALAEFLGQEVELHFMDDWSKTRRSINLQYQNDFTPGEWRMFALAIQQPEGQAALMDTLDSYGIECNFLSHVTPYTVVLDLGILETSGEGDTRQEAFINAILDMPGAKTT